MRTRPQSNKTILAWIMGVSTASSGCADGGSQTNMNTARVSENATSSAVTSTSTPPTGGNLTTTQSTTTGATGATGASTAGGTGGDSGATGDSGDTGALETSPGNAPTSNSAAEGAGPSGAGSNDISDTQGNATGAGEGSQTAGQEDVTSEPAEPFTGTCTESRDTGRNASGTGPHDVVIETNSEDGIRCGTIYRPADLGGGEKYPIFVWGEGGCSQNGLSNQAAMAEIASWGYFVVADGTPGEDNACEGDQSGGALLDYITWAIAENDKPCSAYYKSLEPTKIAADGFSCGGLMSENVAGDPRFTAIGITSSGLMGANNRLWDSMHAPFKIMNGGSSDIAYENGLNDYDAISSRDIPILYFSKTSAGHGGDLNQGRGDFNLVNLAWLNWWLKGDEGPTGKAFLIGPTCEFCNDSGWEFKSANIE